ncbi:MAG TPA: hypothetical protein VFE15_06245 [Marmoricola sp.]|jgi:hypothetical protein|nr:hypothetical protein [Marmoricola sp.]
MTHEPNKLLSRLIGLRLYSVQFGHDHLQLRFETEGSDLLPFLDCEAMPAVEHGGLWSTAEVPGYADALVALIGREVIATVEDTGAGVRVALEGGTVALNPVTEDLVRDEIATLGGFYDGSTIVWEPGSAPFEHLV